MLTKQGKINVMGVYGIKTMQGVVKYIGSALEVNDAYSRHRTNLINGDYYETNKHELQALFNQEDLIFYVIKECKRDDLDKEETKYIKLYYKTIVNRDKKGKRRKNKSTPEETLKRRQSNLGENNPHNTCLTEKDASEILWLKKNTKIKQKDIAQEYECSPNLVSRIGNDRWKSIESIKPTWLLEKLGIEKEVDCTAILSTSGTPASVHM
ncbi:nuclease [Clostridium sp. P21]|uniref:Nuclease n=1 Tax=Clostridium muellerianum TaxID=2716538 RepID=A0A7Y0HR17_9CLOT|nr:nuclease [Clostridium muellerianum]NMM64383.1 nuclease [Clostridium muellerianum]